MFKHLHHCNMFSIMPFFAVGLLIQLSEVIKSFVLKKSWNFIKICYSNVSTASKICLIFRLYSEIGTLSRYCLSLIFDLDIKCGHF